MTTESDRELLGLAAKAAGYSLVWGGPDKDMPRRTDNWNTWAPLDPSYGDALRLAVKLHISINPVGSVSIAQQPGLNTRGSIIEDAKSDPEAATCRAIVRAAAEIGRNMK